VEAKVVTGVDDHSRYCVIAAVVPRANGVHRTGDARRCLVEVERLVNACGLVARAGRQHPVWSQFAGRRVTVRIDRRVLQLASISPSVSSRRWARGRGRVARGELGTGIEQAS
jgi:hypothetical protein